MFRALILYFPDFTKASLSNALFIFKEVFAYSYNKIFELINMSWSAKWQTVLLFLSYLGEYF